MKRFTNILHIRSYLDNLPCTHFEDQTSKPAQIQSFKGETPETCILKGQTKTVWTHQTHLQRPDLDIAVRSKHE